MIKICATCHGRGHGFLYKVKPFFSVQGRTLFDIVGSKRDLSEWKEHLCRTCRGLGYVLDGTLSEIQVEDVAYTLAEVLCDQVQLVMLVRAARAREVRLREELRDFAEELESRTGLLDPCWKCPHNLQCPLHVCPVCSGCDDLEDE